MAKVAANRKTSTKQSNRPRPVITAPFAMTSDGQMLINAAECEGRDLEGRPLFTGVLITKPEGRIVRKAVDDPVWEKVSKIAGMMPVSKPAPAASRKAKSSSDKASTKARARTASPERGTPTGSGEAS
jgi:hypothetical protein